MKTFVTTTMVVAAMSAMCCTGDWHRFLDPPPGYASFPRQVRKTASYVHSGIVVECYEQANGPETSQRVMLALPEGASGRLPAVVVPFYFPEAMLGFNPVDGSNCVTGLVDHATNLAYYASVTYMADLARRGYATICADAYYLTYAKEGRPKNDWEKWGHAGRALLRDWPDWTGVGKLAFDTSLLVDMLVADDRVDASRIGILGHSLGGKMAFYTGCLDKRIKVIVASDFGIGWNQTNWQDVWYWGGRLPEIRGTGATHADLLTMAHGKPFCLIAGQYDNEESGRIMRMAKGYEGHSDRLVLVNHATGHRPPREATEAGYRFLDRFLSRAVDIPYRQLTPEKALETYCDWIVSQIPRYKEPPFEWYFLFYPMRTLLMGANLLNRPDYAEAVWPFMDRYVEEQLPNGALTSNCRGQPGATMTQQEIEDLLSTGKLNLADNGSNVHGLLLGAVTTTDAKRRDRYIAAAKKWLDSWVPIWRLPTGAYGNGIWNGHKLNGPYSMAMNVCSAMAAFTLVTGDEHYIHNAEKFAMFQCDNWHKSGVPVRFNLYPTPSSNTFCQDFARVYYLFEALAWTHYVSRDQNVRARIAQRLKEWIDADLIRRWPDDRDWFDMNKTRCWVADEEVWKAYEPVGFYWQACKAAGMPGLLSYYVNNIEDRADLRDRVARGGKYLCNPLKARMLAVMADDVEPLFCMQATGFGGLGVAEALKPSSTFDIYRIKR